MPNENQDQLQSDSSNLTFYVFLFCMFLLFIAMAFELYVVVFLDEFIPVK